MPELRDYQIEAGRAIATRLNEGVTRQMVVMPTGAGKTVTFATLGEFVPDCYPQLVLAHREELLHQAKDKIERANPHLHVAIEQAEKHAPEDADVVIASVPTLGRANSKRIEKYPTEYFRSVIVDEAHHAAAPTYRRILDYFEPTVTIGFTATPQRSDHTRLDDVFQEIVFFRDLPTMIAAGWLAPLVGYRVETSVDLSTIRITAGDYAEKELSAAVNIDARNEVIVESYQKYGQGIRCLVFCVDVAHSYAVAERFRAHGITSTTIVGTTPAEERAQILADYQAGKIDVLTNCAVLTEGFDAPDIGMVILARPTQSKLFMTQAIGRGTRLAEGKECCLVIDIADVSRKRRPVHLPSLFGLPPAFDLQGTPVHEAAASYSALASRAPGEVVRVSSLEDLQYAWERIDFFSVPPPNPTLLGYSQFIWVEVADDSYSLGLGSNGTVCVQIDALGRCNVQHRDSAGRTTDVGRTEELGAAFKSADDYVRLNYSQQLSLLYNDATWREHPATDKQKRALRRFGVPVTNDLSKGHASMLLDRLFAEAPPRPAWLEKKIAQQRSQRNV